MNLSAIFSKTGKGVQEASGKTSHLSRADRAVLSAIDGKTPLTEVQKKFEKIAAPKFEALIEQLDKDGFIREVSSGASQPAAPVGRTPPAQRAAPPKAPAADSTEDSGLDFTQAIKVPSKGPAATPPKAASLDLAAASRAEAERKAKDQEAFDYKARQEAEAKAQAEAKAREAAAHAKARAEAEANARAEAEAKTRAEADAKVKSAREAAVRMATEANAKVGAADRERQAAEERARKGAEDKARLEAELNAKLAEERKAREEAERRASEAAERARRELEEKARRDAEEMRQRLEAEMKAKLEEERKAREAEDRKRREEEDRKRREDDERRRKEDEARRAKEEAERKAREAEDRKRREEEERRRKEDEARRAKEEAERRARREEEERRAKEEAERRKREEEGRRAKEEGERRAREEQDRKRRKEEDERREKEAAEAKSRAAQPAAAPPPPAAGGDIGDSLLADLDSFSQREEEESRVKEEAERKAKDEAARRAREEAERQAKEEADRKRREEEERRRKEEEERRAREEAERQAREEEARVKQEEADRKRKAKESLAAKQAEDKAVRAASAKGAATTGTAGDDDIGVTEEDLDMDDVKRDHKVLAKAAKKPEFEQGQASAAAAARPVRRPVKWGKPAAIALFVLLVGGVGLLNVMPVSTSDYEKAASEAMGVPVKIGSARLAALTGIEVRFENVSIGDSVKIRLVRGSPEVGSLFGGKKSFSRMELEGASISQDQLAAALLGKIAGENFRVERVVLKQAKFDGPVALPALDVEADIGGDGAVKSVAARGGDKLVVQLSPSGNDISFEISAGSLAMPFVPALTLSDFGWKGSANRNGVAKSVFDGRVYEGVVSGTAKIRWGGSWTVDGEVKARALKVGVFAPALVSEGKIEGKGSYAMSGTVPASLYESAKVQGDFKIEKGVLGSFNLTRALQTGGAQSSGRTEFSELTGQAVYDKGAIQIRNASLSAGAMNAGVSLDIDAGGGLSGRVAADVKTPTQTLRATLGISGKISDPVVHK